MSEAQASTSPVLDTAAGRAHTTTTVAAPPPSFLPAGTIDTLLSGLGFPSALSSSIPASYGGNAAHAGSVRRIVLTGGPCAGKTESMARIREAVEAHTPYKVFTVPEAATLLVGGGLNWGDAKDDAAVLQFQLALLRTQLALEDAFLRIAAACGHPAIVIADRGTMDGRSYMTPALWEQMISSEGHTTDALRDDRYDAVIHLVTSAIGAEAFYSLDNPARYEDAAAAVEADHRTRRMYVGHPCVHVVESAENFDVKVQNAVRVVMQLIGHYDAYQRASQDAGIADAAPVGANADASVIEQEQQQQTKRADVPTAAQCAAHFNRQRRIVGRGGVGGSTHAADSLTAPSLGVTVVLVAAGCYLWLRLKSSAVRPSTP